MSHRIFLADLAHRGTIRNADTFPLGIGFIAAYALQEFGDALDVELFKFPPELDQRLKEVRPRVLGLSHLVWNANLAQAFARHVKAISPHTVVVMGGPQLPLEREDREVFLREHPEIDFYVREEGERAFAALLRELLTVDFDADALRRARPAIENTLFLAPGGGEDAELIEGPCVRMADIMAIPSPYTTGLLDKFFSQGLRPLIETQRGCPFACSFCNEFHDFKRKVKHRTAERLRAELTYIATHLQGPADLVSADNNFGMYPQDPAKARVFRDIIDEYHWPPNIDCSLGKNHADRVLECVKTVNGAAQGIIKFGSSMQSSDPQVLAAIGRANLPPEMIGAITRQRHFASDHTKYFTEIILALPHDSKAKHYESLRTSIDDMGMNIVNVHQLTLMQGTAMNSAEQRAEYGFDSRFRVFVGRLGEYLIGEETQPIAEIEEVVVGHAGMSFEAWCECRVMSLLVKLYIDQDYFAEIFGLVDHLGLSSFRLLRILQDEIFPRDPGLTSLIDLFLKKTVEPLHATYEDALAFVATPGVIHRHATGELGGNELLVYRAKGYMHHSDALHDALLEAARRYLEREGRRTPQVDLYLTEAIRVSRSRKFDVRSYREEITDTFHFDFIRAAETNFRVDLDEIATDATPYLFHLGDRAAAEIEDAIAHWVGRGDDDSPEHRSQHEFNLGKLYHMGNLRDFSRSMRVVGPNYVLTAEPARRPFLRAQRNLPPLVLPG